MKLYIIYSIYTPLGSRCHHSKKNVLPLRMMIQQKTSLTPMKFNSEFTPEKLPKPNRKGSSSFAIIFQGGLLLNFRGVRFSPKNHETPIHQPYMDKTCRGVGVGLLMQGGPRRETSVHPSYPFIRPNNKSCFFVDIL